MKTFRNLTIEGTSASEKPDIEKFVEALTPLLDHGWRRDVQRERELAREHEIYCFACSEKNKRQAARLFLGPSPDRLWVSNIVPLEAAQLSYDEYNLIVCEFYERFAKVAADSLGYKAVLSGDEERIEDFLTAAAIELLHAFCKGSHDGASSLPADRERWFRFLVAAHVEGVSLDGYTLKRWLTEEQRWWEDNASELADEYEFGRALLAHYDRHE